MDKKKKKTFLLGLQMVTTVSRYYVSEKNKNYN